MMATIKIDRIDWTDEDSGNVLYEIRNGDNIVYGCQPFDKLGDHKNEIGQLVWKMTQKDPLTLEPSFRLKWPPHVVHLLLRNGKIELCDDSTVVLV